MDYTIEDGRLILTVDAEDQQRLKRLRDDDPDDFGSDEMMHDELEPLVCNSELRWITPEQTGDLTDAPMLGIWGPEQFDDSGSYGVVLAGRSEGRTLYHPIIERWAFMDYPVRSVLDDLADSGRAEFMGSESC